MSDRLIEIEDACQSLFGASAIVTNFSAYEEISHPFEIVLSVASENLNVESKVAIGKEFAVRITRGEGKPSRQFHGVISHLCVESIITPPLASEQSTPWRVYRLRIVPSIWFMTQASNCFVYLPDEDQKSIGQVFDELFSHASKYIDNLSIPVDLTKILQERKVEHCVQYRETDFNFFSRTLENYGAFYFFVHDAQSHLCLMCDRPRVMNCLDDKVPFRAPNATNDNVDAIYAWEHAFSFIPGMVSQADFNYMTPLAPVQWSVQKRSDVPVVSNSEIYDYPGSFADQDQAETDIERRMEAEECRAETITGQSKCKSFTAGFTFTLSKHAGFPQDENKSYLLTSVHHLANQPGPFSDASGPATYSNRFTCIAGDRQYRPRRQTTRPNVPSVQTATVVGPKGEEIHVDKYGRVRIMFHWDRINRSEMNEFHSCWVRVSQVHAGKSFGAIDIPRVGEEVIVSFIEGDLDRPIITGRVYNKEAMPPFTLPDEKTRSGYKSKTYKGNGYNELTFDDKPGKEQIRVHGEHNMDTLIKNDVTKTIGNNETVKIGTNPKDDPHKNGMSTTTVFGDTRLTVTKGDYYLDIQTGKSDIKVAGEAVAHYKKSRKVTVDTEMKTSSPTIKEVATKLIQNTVESSNIVVTKEHIHLGVGENSFIKITSDAILISVNGSQIKLTPQNISIDSPKIKSAAKGFNEVSGSLVKINCK